MHTLFYNFLIFLNVNFHCSWIWNYRRSMQATNHRVACFLVGKYFVNYLFADMLFQILTVSDNHPYLTAFNLVVILVTFVFVSWIHKGFYEPKGRMHTLFCNFLIFLNVNFHCSWIWNYRRNMQATNHRAAFFLVVNILSTISSLVCFFKFWRFPIITLIWQSSI